jgi:hypothetical protein
MEKNKFSKWRVLLLTFCCLAVLLHIIRMIKGQWDNTLWNCILLLLATIGIFVEVNNIRKRQS